MRICRGFFLVGTVLIAALPMAAADDVVDFNRDVRPVLSDKCFACHGPDAETREAELRVDLREDALADRGGYAVIVPGDASQSTIMERLTTDDPDEKMPPVDFGKELSKEEIELIGRWIDQGAEWPEHWSFIAPSRNALPEVAEDEDDSSTVDHYVRARLTQYGLQLSPAADRRALVRRLSLDLTGLPPSLDEVDAFVEDKEDGAYGRLVDRLLASPHFGERMALAWLDQARYADTNGYSIDGGRHMWLWRDWVIKAYNENMPFDQFVVEQLAGDLLPEGTVEQQIATGFNRNHMITHEGGTIPEENLLNYAVDRVKTTAEVFLGLTMGCAQCHDHKYDPLTRTDFYRFLAFFNTLDDKGLDGNSGINAGPSLQAGTPLGGEAEIAAIKLQLDELKARLSRPLTSQLAWEEEARRQLARRGKDLQLHPFEIEKLTTPNRGLPMLEQDGVISTFAARPRSPSISVKADFDNITGLRVEFLPHEDLPEGGLGHNEADELKGSFVLTSFSASAGTIPSDQVDFYREIPIREATASNSHPDYPPGDSLDPRGHNGWSPHPHNQANQHITYTFAEPLNGSETPHITMLLVWGRGTDLSAGQFRFYALTGTNDGTNIPADVQTILYIPADKRTLENAQRLQDYYATVAPELENVRYQMQNLTERLEFLSQPQQVMVMNTAEKPRKTHMLNRGQYDQLLDEVTAGVPECLPPLPEGADANRLGLAKWLIDPTHPLTARVAVNRIWQQFFGVGIVASSADFGSQGQLPTHPQLLDALALEFVDSGWDVKRLIKNIVMSDTYRQSSRITPELSQADPNNNLLSRGPRFRLQAEFVRDSALRISGLLADYVGGPSVKPYQPSGLWREVSHFGSSPATSQVFVQDHGEKLYRRSMYTYWKRTSPPPSMVSFDAPTREVCTLRRSITNTPLQALVLLNDPQFVEASRAFAERIVKHEGDVRARAAHAFELATARPPLDEEVDVLERAYRRAFEEYRDAPDRAAAYLSVGESFRDESIDPVEHVAWTSVASLVLNLSETITRQ